MIQWNHSPHARESKTVFSGFCALELGFPILIVYNDFGFPASGIPQAKIYRIAESGFPYNSLNELNFHC